MQSRLTTVQKKLKNDYKWIYPENNISDEEFAEIKKTAGSEIIAKLLINRGITNSEEAGYFLDFDNATISSPYIFPDMKKTVERINKAIQDKEHIVVFGDFDADGVTATSLLYKTLKLLGADASYYLPDRQEEGHGLNAACVCKLISGRKTKLLITVDCGISNVSEIKLAVSLGTDVIITDHHEAQEQIPPAFSIINPKMLEENEENKGIKYLAGVGVAYKVAVALLESHNKQELHDEIFYFVALGTVGDVVPLLGENRIFVRRGMDLIAQKRPPAIGKILETGGYKAKHKITTGTVAFGIVPKINAVGRLGNASPIVDFFLSEDEEVLKAFADELNANNKKRQEIGEKIFAEAEQKIKEEINLEESKVIILAKKDWHPGIMGIVASRLVEAHYRPVLLVSFDEEKNEARGSARSIESLNLFDTLSDLSEFFIRFGGHAFAAGYCFDLNKMSFESFKEKINASVEKNSKTKLPVPELKVDAKIQAKDLTEDFIKEIGKLEPFGEANPSPVFSISNLTLLDTKIMGSKKNHLKIFLADDEGLKCEAVWWNKDRLDVEVFEKVNVAFSPSLNHFGDKTTVQLIIKDLKSVSDKAREVKENREETVCCSEVKTTPEITEESGESQQDSNIITKNETYNQSYDSQGITGAEIKWVDHRNATGFKKEFINYMKSLGGNISVFAETPRSLGILENDSELKNFSVNRTTAKKSDCLVIMDLPCDEKTFLSVLNKTEAKKIHLIGLNSEINPVETIKTFSGMLKYAFKNKNGLINIDKTASFLSISSDSVLACIELLDNAGVINVAEVNEDSVKFSFAESTELSKILEHPEYKTFNDSLEESKIFRQNLSESKIEKISAMLSLNCLETV